LLVGRYGLAFPTRSDRPTTIAPRRTTFPLCSSVKVGRGLGFSKRPTVVLTAHRVCQLMSSSCQPSLSRSRSQTSLVQTQLIFIVSTNPFASPPPLPTTLSIRAQKQHTSRHYRARHHSKHDLRSYACLHDRLPPRVARDGFDVIRQSTGQTCDR